MERMDLRWPWLAANEERLELRDCWEARRRATGVVESSKATERTEISD
jgi:hypothetical protein